MKVKNMFVFILSEDKGQRCVAHRRTRTAPRGPTGVTRADPPDRCGRHLGVTDDVPP